MTTLSVKELKSQLQSLGVPASEIGKCVTKEELVAVVDEAHRSNARDQKSTPKPQQHQQHQRQQQPTTMNTDFSEEAVGMYVWRMCDVGDVSRACTVARLVGLTHVRLSSRNSWQW